MLDLVAGKCSKPSETCKKQNLMQQYHSMVHSTYTKPVSQTYELAKDSPSVVRLVAVVTYASAAGSPSGNLSRNR